MGGALPFRARRIRDPIHNLIEFAPRDFDDVIWKVLESRPFQRLRRIKQLGFSDFIYPGATHSRLAHSIGVFHTARQLMRVIETSLGQQFELRKAQTALAAALVHDVGHGPFSHAFEEVGHRFNLKLANHETVSDRLIRDSEISTALQRLGSGFHNDVATVIASKGPRNVYDAVVSSQFDADRLDYMRRDRAMAGSSHGVIDYEWLVSNLQIGTIKTGVDEDQVGELDTFVIGPKGIFAAEAYVLGLFQLYPTIYLHKTTRGLEKLFTELVCRCVELSQDDSVDKTGLPANHPLVLFSRDPDDLDLVLRLDDTVVYGALSQMADAEDPLIAEFSKRIRDRNTYKCFDVRECVAKIIGAPVGEAQAEEKLERIVTAAAEKIETWRNGVGTKLVLRDRTERSPYKQLQESKGPLNQIRVKEPDGSLVDLGRKSLVVRALRTFKVDRYYYNRDNSAFRSKMEAIVKEEIDHGAHD